jgi:plasmid stabilization system protein ParE
MRVGVVLTEDAERILENIYGQISASDSRQNADDVLNRLLEMTEKLTAFPARGDLAKNFAP